MGALFFGSLSACTSLDPLEVQDEVQDEDLTVQWCPETGETTLHFDFGVASDGTTEPPLWNGGYHVSVTAEGSGMGSGVSHAAFKSGQAITDEDMAPMTPGRAWRLTVRGELQERPERAVVRLRGDVAARSREESRSLGARFDLLAPGVEDDSGCQLLVARLHKPDPL